MLFSKFLFAQKKDVYDKGKLEIKSFEASSPWKVVK